MISILCPSRGRPERFRAMWESALSMDEDNVEIVSYHDDDDPTLGDYDWRRGMIIGPRIVLSECWNKCFDASTGDILMHGGDDLEFKTKNWDAIVVQAFAETPDGLVFVHGDDGSPERSASHYNQFGTHGFLHRHWADTVGYFVPPYFSSDYNDTWLNDVANMIGRRVFVPILTEHMHPDWGKGELDQTHRERLDRHARDNVAGLYASLAPERLRDAKKLMHEIEAYANLGHRI